MKTQDARLYLHPLIFRYLWIIVSIYVTFFTNVIWICHSANVPVNTLYDDSDDVTVINNDTFKQTVYGSQHVWFVQFYSSWCGHCVHFAPTWKAFAGDVKNWHKFAKVGAINCADKQNSKVCSEYVDKGFPTLRFFKPLQKNGTGDISEGQRDVASLRHALVDYMSKPSWDLVHWPTLSPVSVEWLMNFFLRNETPWIKFLGAVFEDKDSYVGRELILDMSPMEHVKVVRVLPQELRKNLFIMSKWNVTELPALHIIKSNGDPSELLRLGSREAFSSALQIYLQQTSLKSGSKDKSPDDGQSVDMNAVTVKSITSIAVKKQHLQQQKAKKPSDKKKESRSVVYMQDLESALIYSIKYEIGMQKLVTDDALSALNSYIAVLNKYFPGQSHVMNALKSLEQLLHSYTRISNEQWSNIVQYLQSSEVSGAFLKNDVQWLGCRGSTLVYRGYPCGLWLLFHTLTVSHASMDSLYPGSDSKEVLHAMKGYIQHFFGCRECSENFSKESLNLESEVKTLDESVLWLWNTHNRVNKRLAGDLSEDPQYPKIQFPSLADCQTCYNGGWRESNVLRYLKSLYSVRNIGFLETKAEHKPNDVQADVKMGKMASNGSFNLGIDMTDMSLCFLLYASCLALLMVIYVCVRHRRKIKLLKL